MSSRVSRTVRLPILRSLAESSGRQATTSRSVSSPTRLAQLRVRTGRSSSSTFESSCDGIAFDGVSDGMG